jgi:hypothetical protein
MTFLFVNTRRSDQRLMLFLRQVLTKACNAQVEESWPTSATRHKYRYSLGTTMPI